MLPKNFVTYSKQIEYLRANSDYLLFDAKPLQFIRFSENGKQIDWVSVTKVVVTVIQVQRNKNQTENYAS